MSFLRDAIATLSSVPQQLEYLVRDLSEEQLSRRPATDAFSMRENVLHLRDIDIEGYEKRLRLVLSEDCPKLPDVNGGQLAIERNYNAQPMQPAIADLRRSRAESMERLKDCSEDDLERKAEMEGVGVINLRKLLELWIEHDRGHIADMVELRRTLATAERASFSKHHAA